MIKISKIIPWLRNPWVLISSLVIGVSIGLLEPDFAALIAPFGQLYLLLLKMSVLPILVTVITISIGRLIQSSNIKSYIKRILSVFFLTQILVSVIGVVITFIWKPGKNLNQETLTNLGVLVNKSGIDLEISINGPLPPPEATLGLDSFLFNLIPDNIFTALSEGETLKVLFFSIIFGLALGVQGKQVKNEAIFDIFESIYQAFNKLINWLTLLLPFGMCSLLAFQISQTGLDVLFAMINFVLTGLATFMFIYVVFTIIIWQRSKTSLFQVFFAAKEPTILALATSNAFVCLPSAINSLTECLKFNRQTTDLIFPLTITIGRFGQIVYFSLASLFVVQLYQTDLSWGGLIIIIMGSILAGMASSGATGIVTLATLSIVLQPLGLPLEAVLVLLIAIDPMMDPLRTLCNVHTGIVATAMIADLESNN